MRKLEQKLGEIIQAKFCWVDFILCNTDVLMALSHGPVQVIRVSENKFSGSVFGVALTLNLVKHEVREQKGVIQILAEIEHAIGRTYTVVDYEYASVDEQKTAVSLKLSMKLPIFMGFYASAINSKIDKYLGKLLGDIAAAARTLDSKDDDLMSVLTGEQRQRIESFRKIKPKCTGPSISLHGALRIAMTQDVMLVTAEAKLPDQRIISGTEDVPMDSATYHAFLSGMKRLAAINNQAGVVRGVATKIVENLDFRQAALEFGHGFYRKICCGRLMGVLPVMLKHGSSCAIRLAIDGHAEELPWEALHDGDDFLCLSVRLSRAAIAVQDSHLGTETWSNPGILIIGADSKGDLPGVEREACKIGEVLVDAGILKTEVLVGKQANREAVVRALESGAFNMVHFSGHTICDAAYPQRSSMELVNGKSVRLFELKKLAKGLDLMFLNSCESASFGEDRVTGRHLSMCKTLREAGIQIVIGMLWNVDDQAAAQVGSTFYRNLFENPDLGPEEAMRRTRNSVGMKCEWVDGSWLAPVLYT